MKKILSFLLLISLAARAQVTTTTTSSSTNDIESLREALRERIARDEGRATTSSGIPAPAPRTSTQPGQQSSTPSSIAGAGLTNSAPLVGISPVAGTTNRPALQPGLLLPPSGPGAAGAPANAGAPGIAAPIAPGAPPGAIGDLAGNPALTVPVFADDPATNLFDLPKIDLDTFLNEFYAPIIGRTIFRSPQLNAAINLTLRTTTKLTRRETIEAFDTVLSMNGIATIPQGTKFLRIVPMQVVPGEADVLRYSMTNAPDAGLITYIVHLQYVKPGEIVSLLQAFSKTQNLVPIDGSQMLIIRDFAENVRRMEELIKTIDVEVPTEIISEVIPIKYAKADEIAGALSSLSGTGGGAAVVGTPGGGRSGARGTSPFGARGGVGGMGGGGFGTQQPGMPNIPGSTSPFGATAPGTVPGQPNYSGRLQGIMQAAGGAGGAGAFQIIGQTKIVTDPRSNSLLVFATREDMKTIKDIIKKIDVVLPQVLIETIIMDVTLSKTWNFGISAVQRANQFGPSAKGAGGYNNGQGFLDFAQLGTNALGSFLSGGMSYFGSVGSNPEFDLALQAAAADGSVNVIQKPRLLTTHATPASIFIGSTVPYVTSTYYGGGYAGGPSSSYQPLQVGVTIEVTPYINADGLVVMEISQISLSEVSGSTAINGVGDVPNTTQRSIMANVAVKDGDTIVLGGIIRNSETRNNSGVPILKDLPILGVLFSSRNSAKGRSELLILMRPTVLRTPELASAQTAKEKENLPGIRIAETALEAAERRAATNSTGKTWK